MNNNVCKNDIGVIFDKFFIICIEFEEKFMNFLCF